MRFFLMTSFAMVALLLVSQPSVRAQSDAEESKTTTTTNTTTTQADSETSNSSSQSSTQQASNIKSAPAQQPLTVLIEKFKRPSFFTRAFNGIKGIFNYPKSLTRVTVDSPSPLHPDQVAQAMAQAIPQVNVTLVKHKS